jgi:V8-like Glu-specific endopeptidase
MRHNQIFFAVTLLLSAACKHSGQDASEAKVTNSLDIAASEAPYAIMLLMDNETLCTGAWVSKTQVLTAAHCLRNRKEARIVKPGIFNALFGYKTLASSTRLSWHPGYRRSQDVAFDLGVIEFSPAELARLGDVAVVAITAKQPVVGAEITMVGYGNDTIDKELVFGEMRQSGQGPLRAGVNTIGALGPGHFVFRGYPSRQAAEANELAAGHQVSAASGDSGGPILDAAGQLLGVVSAGQPIRSGFDQVVQVESLAVDLTSAGAREFLRQHALAP